MRNGELCLVALWLRQCTFISRFIFISYAHYLRISSFLQKIDALQWTPHMDECLQVLEEAKECLNDRILVQQVRLQLIAEKMAQAILHNGAMEYTKHKTELPPLYFQSLHSQFQNNKSRILAETQADGKMLCPYQSTFSLTLQ
jgi:hypothetical protein